MNGPQRTAESRKEVMGPSSLLEKSQKTGSKLSRHLVDVFELFSAIFL